eukprot:365252-Chlamydomonas_euryale.AAC.51
MAACLRLPSDGHLSSEGLPAGAARAACPARADCPARALTKALTRSRPHAMGPMPSAMSWGGILCLRTAYLRTCTH